MSHPLTKPLNIKRIIMAGILVWVPLGITIFAIKLMVNLLDQSLLLLPYDLRPEQLLGFYLPGVGIIISTIIVISTGFIVTNIVGHRMMSVGEDLLNQIPLVRSIYSAVKQVTHTLLSQEKNSFRQVLLIEYPRKGTWTMAFQTGKAMDSFNEVTGKELITVFVPTTPNPTSGFILMLPESEVKKLDIDVEDALKFVMSLGVVMPGDKIEEMAKVDNTSLREILFNAKPNFSREKISKILNKKNNDDQNNDQRPK